MRLFSRRKIALVFILFALVIAVAAISPRYRAEDANRTVAFVADYGDMATFAMQDGAKQSDIWAKMSQNGIAGLTVQEYSGDDLKFINPLPLRYGSAGELGISYDNIGSDRAAVVVNKSLKYIGTLKKYIMTKMPDTIAIERGDSLILFLPGTAEELRFAAFMPNFPGLEFCRKNNVITLFRPGPCTPSDGKRVADSLEYLISEYPQIKNIIPAGTIMAGNPDFAPIVDMMKRHNVSVSQVEFVKQIGVSSFIAKMKTGVIPLHSLTLDEILSKKVSRQQRLDRFIRAVHERSVRILVMRTYDPDMGDRFDSFLRDTESVRSSLEAKGYILGWPKALPAWPVPSAGAAACAIVLAFCAWLYIARINGSIDEMPHTAELVTVFISAAVLCLLFLKVSAAAKLFGGLCGAIAATEAAMAALESSKNPLRGALTGLFVILAGGMAIASFYGTTSAALRITPFSGVKLTLLLPPLLLLVHDLKTRVHPESVSEICVRPAIWGELVLIGVMMLALLVMALRSDNVSNVPAIEVTFRDFMEKLLIIRPRTKEFLIGYPMLVVYWYLVRRGMAAHYREVFRMAASLAFCSAINTFCHFHTFIRLSVIRVLNGWWLGLALGVLLVVFLHFIAMPVYRKYLGEMID